MDKQKCLELIDTIFDEDLDSLNILLDNISRTEINFWDEVHNITPLSCAIGTNNPMIVEIILRKGGDANFFINGLSLPLIQILEGAMEIDEYEEPGLDDAVKILELLLEYGADINVKNYNGLTPYEYAKGHFPPAISIFDKMKK